MQVLAVSASEIDKNTIGGGNYITRTYQTYAGVYITDYKVGSGKTALVDSTGSVVVLTNLNDINAFGSNLLVCHLIKYSSTGALLWQKKISYVGPPTKNVRGYGIALDTSNNIYVLSQDDYASNVTVYITKFDSTGVLQWERRLYNPSWTNASFGGVAFDTSNNIYVVGRSYGGTTQNWNSALVKIDSTGAIVWAKENYTNNFDSANSTVVDASGNVYVIGQTDIVTSPYTNKMTISKYNSSGTIQWNRVIDFGGSAFPYAPVVDSTGNLYLIGSYYTSPGTAGTSYPMLIKYNSSGVLQWQKTLGASFPPAGTFAAAVDASDNLYVATYATGTNAMLIAKLDTSGAVISGSTRMVDTRMNTGSTVAPYTLNLGAYGVNISGSTIYFSGVTNLTTVLPSFDNSSVINYKMPLGTSKYGIYAIPNEYSFQYAGTAEITTTNTSYSESAWSASNQNANLTITSSSALTYTADALINQVIN